MADIPLKERCRIVTNTEPDTFVGIRCNGNNTDISFPAGFHLENDDKSIRKDVLLLLYVLTKNTDKKESELNYNDISDSVEFPVQAYLQVIWDYYASGYYKESETVNEVSRQGKINWNKTVKTCKPYIQDDEIYYLDFVTKRKNVNENELITLIHQFCVHESFNKIGWLFTSYKPPKPQIRFNKKYFIVIIKKKISETFNDRNKQLFKNMLAIILSLGDDGPVTDFKYGTSRFEYVWESMIDKAYGIRHKEDYFPSTRWKFADGERKNSQLEPDTIMLVNGSKSKVYVLDAKYYTFGTRRNGSLPGSTSINKQITYGEFIAESGKFNDEEGNSPTVYNAFIMPYDAYGMLFPTETELYYVGSAISDWKSSDGTKTYEEIAGILLDVKSLMRDYSHNDERIMELANLIEVNIVKDQ